MLHGCSNLGKMRRQYAPRLSIADRREQVLDAALQVIVRDGYAKVSIEAVAREAGITRPVVYSAYDGLGPLLLALLDRQQIRAIEQLEGLIPDTLSPGDPGGFALRAIEAWMNAVVTDPMTWRPILTQQYGTPEVVRDRIEATRGHIRQQLSNLIFSGYAESLPDTEVAAHMLLAVLEHFGTLLLEDPPRYEPARMAATLARMLTALR